MGDETQFKVRIHNSIQCCGWMSQTLAINRKVFFTLACAMVRPTTRGLMAKCSALEIRASGNQQ